MCKPLKIIYSIFDIKKMKQQHQQQQQQQHQQSLQFNKKKYSIEYQLKDFICVYVTNEEQSKHILLNRGKFKMPKLN